MKRRYLSIGISILLCAFLVVGLVAVCNVNAAADTLTNLNGTKWLFNSVIVPPDSVQNKLFPARFNITAGGSTFYVEVNACNINPSSYEFWFISPPNGAGVNMQILYANNITVLGVHYNGWIYIENENYYPLTNVIVEFTGSATNSFLIEWMQNNAVQIVNYSINYHTNGGVLQSGFSNPQTVSVSNLPNPLPTVTSDNDNFYGWYYDSDFRTPALPSDTISSNVDLYAKMIPTNGRVLTGVFDIFVSGISSFTGSVASGINSFISSMAINSGGTGITVFLGCVIIFAGIALCCGFSKFVVYFISKFGR